MNRLEEAVRTNVEKPLLCSSIYTYNPAFAEIAAKVGFHVLWIEMEHGHIPFDKAADLCRMASGAGMLSMIRIPDARRENVLKAAECGPDIIDLPMVNAPEIAAEFVKHARYAPDGERGFFGSSRAQNYGLMDGFAKDRQRINQELCLMAQIETAEAVERAEEICAVPGIDAILLGLGDLSASLGIVGQTKHEKVMEAAEKAIAAAKRAGKIVALAGLAKDAGMWSAKGVDMLACAGDVMCMRIGAQAIIADVRGG
jgi:2-keto-3-deoxy-L-rhamnonate aldolase RhmA